MNHPLLFTSINLRGLTLDNRINVSPMSMYDAAADGCPTPWHHMHYGNLAVSGAGLVTVEATYVSDQSRSTPGDLGLWNETHAKSLREMLTVCRTHGNTRFAIQLSHAGRKGAGPVAWMPNSEPHNWQLLGPSALAFDGRRRPQEMTERDIAQVVDDFCASARLAEIADFDMIELHAGHGYLLHSFLSPIANQRGDRYGGNLENRMRLVLEVFEAVRDAWPNEKPICLRLSCSDWIEGGWDIAQSVVLARKLAELGCDIVTASSGGISLRQNIRRSPGYQVPFADTLRREAGIAIQAVGEITDAFQAEAILSEGRADMVTLGRAMINHPRWPWHAARALGAEPTHPPHYQRAVNALTSA